MDPILTPILTSFTAGILVNIATKLGEHIYKGLPNKIRKKIVSDEIREAFNNCVKLAVAETIRRVSADLPDVEAKHLQSLYEPFFDNADVGIELAAILRCKKVDMDELCGLFEDAGYDVKTLPGLPFKEAINSFEAMLVEAIEFEPLLQPIIEIKMIKKELELQEELLAEVRQLVVFIKGVDLEKIVINAGKIIGDSIKDNREIIYMPNPAVEQKEQLHENSYLEHVITKCGNLDLSVIEETPIQSSDHGVNYTLKIADVFTTLFLKGVSRKQNESVHDVLSRKKQKDEGEHLSGKNEETLPIQAIEATGVMDRLVILGRPGGGKSTIANHLVTTLANIKIGKNEMIKKLPGWAVEDVKMPVRIVLREFASWIPKDKLRGVEGLVWDYIEELLKTWGCNRYYKSLQDRLIEEGGVLVFDGLDEVSDEDDKKRVIIVNAIKDFARSQKRCRFIITCREYAYQKENSWHLPENEFPVVELDLFKNDQISSFIKTWYMATGRLKGWEDKTSQNKANDLMNAVKSYSHLNSIAQYPLLLTLMAQVHGCIGYLPKDRADLYERAVNLLLAHWDNRIVSDEKGGSIVEQGLVMKLGIRIDSIRNALEKIALAVHEKQQKDGDVSQCANIHRYDLLQALRDSAGIDSNQADKIVEYIQNRAGLLLARDRDTFAFPHRTFQEYLAACAIKQQYDFAGYLKERIKQHLPWWSEVFLLAAGSSGKTPKNVYDLIDALLPNDYGKVGMTKEIILFAELSAQAINETDFLTHVKAEPKEPPGRFFNIHKRIQGWLLNAIKADKFLKPTDRCSAGTALAKIGDPRFDPVFWYLPTKDDNFGFVRIEAGEFEMGSSKDEPDAMGREFPRHTVYVDEFYINKYPVTVAQFREFVEDAGYDAGERWKMGVGNHPVVNVSWDDARVYCEWLSGKLSGMGYENVRLPTEAEWEKAVRGTGKGRYPWGDNADSDKMNYGETGIGNTSAVGCFPGSNNSYGLQDMNGNVLEWVEDDWHNNYDGAPADGSAWIDKSKRGSSRVLRGGSWFYYARNCRSADRNWLEPGFRDLNAGFRLVLPRSVEKAVK